MRTVQTSAVESDFKKSNKSRIPIIRFSDFIRFFNRQKALALVVILRCVSPMQDLWFQGNKCLKNILMQDPYPKCRHFGIFAKKSNKKSNLGFPILSDFQTFPDFQTFRYHSSILKIILHDIFPNGQFWPSSDYCDGANQTGVKDYQHSDGQHLLVSQYCRASRCHSTTLSSL